ncbi:MAG TPA: magnesium chelatase subunit D family protein [Methanothrix sp.]|nr:magnesium chelatase subunit D family protein [Methanothrix sp.]
MHHLKRKTIPFTSIVGQEDMKFALILNAVNPRIGGVLIRGDKGTAKSTAVRALADLLEEISVVEGCPFGCDPSSPQEMCDLCHEKSESGQIRIAAKKTPVVDLPLGATEDRVVGSLNVERAIKEGIRALEPGILAAANRGILYIDEVNLLDDHVADVLLDCSAMGVNIVEREGVSVAHPSKFILVGTMNPEEGELRPQLLDRFGLQVSVDAISDIDQRVQIARNAEGFDADPQGFALQFLPAQKELKEKIARARCALPDVVLADDLLRSIAMTCIDLGVRTHRAEIVISRTARTIAAFDGRKQATAEDAKKAMELALAHRMRSRPFEPPTLNREKLEESLERSREHRDRMDEEKSHSRQQKGQAREEDGRQDDRPQDDRPQDDPGEHQDGGQDADPDRGAKSEHSEKIFKAGSPVDVRGIEAFRRRDRMARKRTRGRRANTLAKNSRGRYLRQRMPLRRKGIDIAIDATIRAAAPYQSCRPGKNAVKIRGEDIREKERLARTSAVVLFVVDSSGSMGAMQRMEGAKGAIVSLLTDSYQKRDRIGMVAFKGREAELILPLCSSVDLARSRLEELPTGGRTPLSAGLTRGLQILQSEMIKDRETLAMMVLISDGRANVGMGAGTAASAVGMSGAGIRDELLEISEQYRQLGVQTVVIDTEGAESSFMGMGLGYCRQIAQSACARYYPLSSLSSAGIYEIVDREQQTLFEQNA